MHRLALILVVVFMEACLWEFSKAEPCPALYRRYSTDHTYCRPPNGNCTIVKRLLNPDSFRIILKEHNRYRSNLAMGQENIGELPKATNMLQMEWDDELAAIAQKHADQCQFEHDRSEQRRTKNFSVGQNLYMKYGRGSVSKPAWRAAVKAWYDEVSNYDKVIIPSFDINKGKGVIGHFTQVVWAESWKVGCGYTVYKDGDVNKEIYVCNYGPAGNMQQAAMYKIGETCSDCPINSCCGDGCPQVEYPGLCKLTDNRGPQYRNSARDNAMFFCNFQPESMCSFQASPTLKGWEISNTASGSYIGIVLEGGQSATLNLTNTFSSDTASCFSIHYRKGPNVAGEASASSVVEHFLIKGSGTDIPIALNRDSDGFFKFGMNLNWANVEFLVSFALSVPAGKPAQFFELQDFTFTKGGC